LLVHVEGETEESFVNEVLAPHLYRSGYENVSARLVGNARQRDRRGGIRGWNTVRKDIVNHLREDPGCIATTMVDFYALPRDGEKAWPGRREAAMLPFVQKAAAVHDALLNDIRTEMGDGFNPARFVPYVVMHEFEGLLFSDCEGFARGIGRPELIPELQAIRNQFVTPEEINDSPITAPSKRVTNLVPGYQKPLLGNLAALEIGLAKIRNQCPQFDAWLTRLGA
jgi:hypothetical protein